MAANLNLSRLTRAVAFIASVCVMSLGAEARLHQQAGFTVTGRVVVSGSLRPIADAVVELGDGARLAHDVTDEGGRFSMKASARGYYDLVASKPGYPPTAYQASASGRAGVRVALFEGDVQDLRLVLARGAVIAGQVLTADGRPAAQVRVQPIVNEDARSSDLAPYLSEQLRQWIAQASVVTDSAGRFRLFGLPPGTYSARVTAVRAPPGVTGREPAAIEGLGGPMPVMAGEERSAVIHLRPATPTSPPGVLTGRILTDGTAARAISVVGRREDDDGGRVAVGAIAEPGVPFQIDRVKPGHYRVEARALDAGSPATGNMIWGVATVDVASGQAAQFELRLTAVPSLDFRIHVTDRQTPAGELKILLAPLSPWGPERAATIMIGPDERGSAPVAPGRYRVDVVERHGATDVPLAVESVRRGEDPPTENVLTVSDALEPAVVEVHVAARRHELTGLIVGPNDRPVTTYSLLIYPDVAALRSPALGRVRLVRPATDGRFFSGPLAVGRYLVVALEDPDPGQALDEKFLESATAQAILASVNQEGSSTITVRVVR